MLTLGECFGLSKQVEVLLIILVGIGAAIFDSSLFYLKPNLEEVWNLTLDPYLYPIMVQLYIKYILTCIIIVKSFTVHIQLALYIVLLWPAFFGDRRNLIIPWLIVGFIRHILTNTVTCSTGVYVCLVHEGIKPICLDFFIAQLIDHGPSIYSWFLVLSYYVDLKNADVVRVKKRNDFEEQLAMRRKKARCMSSMDHLNFDDKTDDGRNLISESTINNLVHYFQTNLSLSKSRSVDTLLDLKAAEEEKEEILNVYEEYGNEDDIDKSPIERAMKLFNIAYDDINKAKKDKCKRNMKIFSDITLDANNLMLDKKRLLSTVSSTSFFVKHGKNYLLRWKQYKPPPSSSFYEDAQGEDFEEGTCKGKESLNNELELVNMFLEKSGKNEMNKKSGDCALNDDCTRDNLVVKEYFNEHAVMAGIQTQERKFEIEDFACQVSSNEE